MDLEFEAQSILPQLDPAFNRGVWVLHNCSPYLTDSFRRAIDLMVDTNAIACTCTTMDILAGESLRYSRNRGQRGFCMWLGHHPAALGRRVAWAAVVHEASHYLTDRHPSRDEQDEAKAVADWWGNWGTNDHGDRWRRAAAHLTFRAMRMGVDIHVDALFQDYGGTDFMAGMRDELVSRANEPIESILGSGAAIPPAPKAQSAAPQSKSTRWPKVMMAGGMVLFHRDGSVERPADLYGRGGERFPSIEAYRRSIREQESVA